MSILHDSTLWAMLGGTPSIRYDVGAAQEQREQSLREFMLGLGAMQQQGFNPFDFQRQQAQRMVPMQAMISYPPEPPRKKVESKVIETVEIRPEQDVRLLNAGEGI